MNARRIPLEALKERSGVCFGGFRPRKQVEESRALARGAPLKGGCNLVPPFIKPACRQAGGIQGDDKEAS
jgi:hypothetical protein